MKRVLGSILAGLSLLGGAAVLFPACVHDDSSLFILDALAQPANATSGVCGYTADPTQPYIDVRRPSGLRSFGGEYIATFLVGNQMVPEVNPTQLMTETSFVNIQGAVVRVTKSTGEPVISFTRLTATSIPPSTGTTPGYGAVQVLLLDPMHAQPRTPTSSTLLAFARPPFPLNRSSDSLRIRSSSASPSAAKMWNRTNSNFQSMSATVA